MTFVPFQGSKAVAQTTFKKGKSFRAVRKIRQYIEDFDAREFAEQAQEVYINAHKALAE